MGVSKGYRKPTSRRRLREEYQKELDALPVGDPKRLTVIRLMAKLEGHDSKLRATDYPDRHNKKKKDEPEPAAVVDGDDEPLSDELQARTDNYERSSRAWQAYFEGVGPAPVQFTEQPLNPSVKKGIQQ